MRIGMSFLFKNLQLTRNLHMVIASFQGQIKIISPIKRNTGKLVWVSFMFSYFKWWGFLFPFPYSSIGQVSFLLCFRNSTNVVSKSFAQFRCPQSTDFSFWNRMIPFQFRLVKTFFFDLGRWLLTDRKPKMIRSWVKLPPNTVFIQSISKTQKFTVPILWLAKNISQKQTNTKPPKKYRSGWEKEKQSAINQAMQIIHHLGK